MARGSLSWSQSRVDEASPRLKIKVEEAPLPLMLHKGKGGSNIGLIKRWLKTLRDKTLLLKKVALGPLANINSNKQLYVRHVDHAII